MDKLKFRVGRKVGRTIYSDDQLIGVMDTVELATQVVNALNCHQEMLDALKAVAKAAKAEPAMNNQRYDWLGTRVMDAISKAEIK